MSVFEKVFGRLEEQREAKQKQLATNYEALCATIVGQVRGDGKKAGEEKVLAFVEDCVHAGVATPEQIQKLHDAAKRLHGYITEGETPVADEAAAEANYRAVCDRCNAEMKAAGQAIHQARDTNSHRNSSRQEAQRLVNKFPELVCMFDKASWKPRIEPVPKPSSVPGMLQYETH